MATRSVACQGENHEGRTRGSAGRAGACVVVRARAPLGQGLSGAVLVDGALDGLRIVRGDRRPDAMPGVDVECDLFLGSARVEVPPVAEVTRAPEPPSSDTDWEALHRPDRRVGDPLVAPRVVAPDDETRVVADDPAVVV